MPSLSIATSPEREREEQRHWRLLPDFRQMMQFDALLANEFRDPEEIGLQQDQELARVLRFAAARVPFYQGRFAEAGLTPDDTTGSKDLLRLPLLTKAEVQENGEALRATALPKGEKVYGWFGSSGTTGRATMVLHSRTSNWMFTLLEQRQLRWFRWNPKGLRADIRVSTQFPPTAEGQRRPLGSSFKQDRWRYVGRLFETGGYAGICVTAPMERQIAWLRETGPEYLMAYPSTLERLAFDLGPAAADFGIQGVYAISEQMTAAMRHRTEENFGIAVDENYGLNEIGRVAQRCRAGRYHVNAEHCFVEIVDDEGRPCQPGKIGRLVVTALRNLAMPLIRYETGDLAMAVEGPCPCGRTLPAFGTIHGRYRRMAYAPDGTSLQVHCLKVALESMPHDLNANLRQYQIRQKPDGSYVIQTTVTEALPPGFETWIRRKWEDDIPPPRPDLALQRVDTIPLSPSGKTEDFVSECAPPADALPQR